MTIDATRVSRLSVGWRDSAQSIVDLDAGDTGATLSVEGAAQFDGATTFASTTSFTGAASLGAVTGTTGVFSSTLSVGGVVTLDHDVSALSAFVAGSTVSVTGTSSLGAIVGASTLSMVGTSDFANISVGGGTDVAGISSSIVSVNLGSVAPNDSSTVSVALANAADGDIIIGTPASIWSGAYFDLALTYTVEQAGAVTIAAANSTATAVDPDAMNFRIMRIGW